MQGIHTLLQAYPPGLAKGEAFAKLLTNRAVCNLWLNKPATILSDCQQALQVWCLLVARYSPVQGDYSVWKS